MAPACCRLVQLMSTVSRNCPRMVLLLCRVVLIAVSTDHSHQTLHVQTSPSNLLSDAAYVPQRRVHLPY